jgi:hypothetical protein
MKDAEHIAQTAALLAARSARARVPGASGSPTLAAEDAVELHRIATKLHRYDERNCCEDLGCRECQGNGYTSDAASPEVVRPCRKCAGKGHTLGRREARAKARAREIAKPYGLRVYFQGDCRGAPVYLIPNDAGTPSEDHSNYSSWGVAVCHIGR